jgi:hypothetical protein
MEGVSILLYFRSSYLSEFAATYPRICISEVRCLFISSPHLSHRFYPPVLVCLGRDVIRILIIVLLHL